MKVRNLALGTFLAGALATGAAFAQGNDSGTAGSNNGSDTAGARSAANTGQTGAHSPKHRKGVRSSHATATKSTSSTGDTGAQDMAKSGDQAAGSADNGSVPSPAADTGQAASGAHNGSMEGADPRGGRQKTIQGNNNTEHRELKR